MITHDRPAPDAGATRPLALVTGSAKRLGRHIIEAFAAAGYDCVVHANRSMDEAVGVKSMLERSGVCAQVVQLEIDEPAAASDALISQVVSQFGRLPNASVLCAASYDDDDAYEPDALLLHRQLNLNFLFQVQYCANLADRVRQDRQNRRAHSQGSTIAAADHSVTLLTDYKVFRVNADFFSYSVAKHAVHGVLPYLAVTFARDVRINAMAPGPILAAHGMEQSRLESLVSKQSVSGRHPIPQDLARTAVYLAQTTSLIGQHICVDAGARFPLVQEVCFED